MRKSAPFHLAALLLCSLPLGACVLPVFPPSGLELSWRFLEVYPVAADEEEPPVRTCVGSGFETVVFDIDDTRDEVRQGTFAFDCEIGFQTEEEFQTQSTSAYVNLNGSLYAIAVAGDGMTEFGVPLGTEEVSVSSQTTTLHAFLLARDGVTWSFDLASPQACAQMTMSLFYADPKATLTEPLLDEAENALPMLYRPNLLTDTGLSLSGAPIVCEAGIVTTHRVVGIDPGAYRLEIARDGVVCRMPLQITGEGRTDTFDLANLVCEG